MVHAYEKLCQSVLEGIGGKENINDVFHCITRLRIIAKDKSKVDFEKLRNTEDILQVKETGNQIQLVIGLQVPEVYSDFCDIVGIEEKAAVDEDEDDSKIVDSTSENQKIEKPKHKENPVTRFLNTLAAILTPALTGMIAGGLLKGVLATVAVFGWMSTDGDVYKVLNLIADAPFWFLPFLIGFSAAKKFKIEPEFGLIVAGILMYPTILNGADTSTTFRFFFVDIPCVNYKATIFPVIISVYVFAIIYKFINKYTPVKLRIVFVGFLSLMIAGPIILGIAAPIGNYITVVLIDFFSWMFNWNGWLAGALFCGLIPLQIIFGIRGFGPIELGNHERFGFDYLLPMFFYSNLAVSGATLAAALKMKKGSSRRSAAVSSGFLGILGITEPALYGTVVPLKTPLIATIVAGALAGGLAMQLKVVQYAYVMPGITSVATYIDDKGNIFRLLIVMAIAWGVSFAISYVLTKKSNVESL